MRFLLIRPPVVHLRKDFYGSIPGIPSGIAYLAAAVRSAGHEVRILDAFGSCPHRFYVYRERYLARGMKPAEVVESIGGGPLPGAIGISVHCTSEHSMSVEITQRLRSAFPEVPVVVGGYHATFVPGEFNRAGAAFVVIGAGEDRLPALLSALEKGEDPTRSMEGISTPDGLIPRRKIYAVDLEAQPFAAVDLLPLESYWKLGYGHGPVRGRYMNILTSRGCPYNCAFCQAPRMCGGRWVAKSPERVLQEIEHHKALYGLRDFHIQDENFALDRKRVEAICRGLMERGTDITFCFPSGLKMETLDEELLDLMSRAGCRYISVSPETGSRRVLELMHKTANIEMVPRLVRKSFSLGMSSCAFFVAGYPGETEDDRRETRKYIMRLAREGIDEVIMPILTPYPETDAMEEESLQGFSELDELCFSPVWRSDYRMLNRYRILTYLLFYWMRLVSHPLRFLGQIARVITGSSRTKGEMTARRLLRDAFDRVFGSLLRPEGCRPPRSDRNGPGGTNRPAAPSSGRDREEARSAPAR